MRPGDTVPFSFWRQTLQGSPATGKLITDFATSFNRNGVLASVSPSLAEGASVGKWREYFLNVTLPASGPYMFSGLITPARGYDAIMGGAISMEVEANDLDSTAALATRTIAMVANTAGLGAVIQLNMAARRRNQVRVTLLDQTGAPIDLSTYSNARFTVWDKTHTGGTFLYQLAAGITMSAAGAIAFDVPETAAFYSTSDTAITAGQDTNTIYYDLIADAAGVAANTDPIIRGTILLDRWEGAA